MAAKRTKQPGPDHRPVGLHGLLTQKTSWEPIRGKEFRAMAVLNLPNGYHDPPKGKLANVVTYR